MSEETSCSINTNMEPDKQATAGGNTDNPEPRPSTSAPPRYLPTPEPTVFAKPAIPASRPTKKVTGTASRTSRVNPESLGKQSSGSKSRRSPDVAVASQNFSQGSNSSKGKDHRSYKDMLERVKKLHSTADKLHERICRLQNSHCEVLIKSAFLITPDVMEILNRSTKDFGIDKELSAPDEIFFRRSDVQNRYHNLARQLDERKLQMQDSNSTGDVQGEELMQIN